MCAIAAHRENFNAPIKKKKQICSGEGTMGSGGIASLFVFLSPAGSRSLVFGEHKDVYYQDLAPVVLAPTFFI